MKKIDTQTYEIGFSYDCEEDGETVDYAMETFKDLTNENVKELEKDETGEEWMRLVSYLVNEEETTNIQQEEISNLTWEYSRKIDRRTQEYKEIAWRVT